MRKGIVQIFLSVVCMGAVAYGVLWMVASSHLAHEFCNGEFSLFHEQFRCRQPYLAIIMALVFGILSLLLLFKGLKRGRRTGHNN